MIYFVTNKKEYYELAYNKAIFPDITIVNEQEGKKLFYEKLGKKRMLANDIEATGLDAYELTPLLFGLGTKHVQFAFDWTIDVKEIFEHIQKYNIISLGHNLSYDYKIIKVHTNILLERTYDTMIAEQRIWMRLGYTHNLADVTQRYLKKVRIKETRNDFIGANINTFKISPAHLYYLRDDLVDLFDIRKAQVKLMKHYKMEFLIYGIEFPFISAIVEAELKGFVFDEAKWKIRVQEDKDSKFELLRRLDNHVRQLRDFKAIENPAIRDRLIGGRFSKDRVFNPLYDKFKPDGTTTELDLFGNFATKLGLTKVKKKVVEYPNNINYASPTQLTYIFAALEEPLYNKRDTLEVPLLNKKGKIIGGVNQFVRNSKAFEKFVLLNPNHIMVPFVNDLIKLGQLNTAINTFGEIFISKVSKITKRIHTIFRQCVADTGRLQSGGGKKQPDKYNAQNIPKDLRYRHCFTTDIDTHSVDTSDYSGAELLVMASHAQDFRLIELSEGDMHSHMATLSWRAIYAKRAMVVYNYVTTTIFGTTEEREKYVKEYRELSDKAKNYLVSKLIKDIRDSFKSMTFGVIYGMFAKKAGETLNIAKDEGQIVINIIKKEIPKTIAMVEAASRHAEEHGYVILDDRTNGRMWFPILIKQLRGELNKKDNFIEISEELSAARNGRIQGTQATFVKEASVVLRKQIKKHKKLIPGFDATILSWVHDEIVGEHTKQHNGKSYAWLKWHTEENQTQFSFIGKSFNNYPEFKTFIMEEVANRYLKGVKIKVETEVEPYWTK